MRRVLATSGMVLTLMALASAPAAAQSQGGQGRARAKDSAESRSASGPVADLEIRIIRAYFAERKVTPKPLPPGIAKNLARGKPLPPGIAKTQLPADLVARLPARPDHRWVIEGNLVILVDPVGIVIDILRDVF